MNSSDTFSLQALAPEGCGQTQTNESGGAGPARFLSLIAVAPEFLSEKHPFPPTRPRGKATSSRLAPATDASGQAESARPGEDFAVQGVKSSDLGLL